MERLSMQSPDYIQKNVEKLATLFPECVFHEMDEDGNRVLKVDYLKLINLTSDISYLGDNKATEPSSIDAKKAHTLKNHQEEKETQSKSPIKVHADSVGDMGAAVKLVDVNELDDAYLRRVFNLDVMRYEFTWPNKLESLKLTYQPTSNTLRPDLASSVDFAHTKNLYIEGDNLEVLKVIRETYLNKVKLIYIDPPYNTGNDFIYNDEFKLDAKRYAQLIKGDDALSKVYVKNTDLNGRFHTDWLNMMLPRLKVARELLCENGVIFISIDESEVDNLKKLCDSPEVFGEQNYVGRFIWAAGRKNDSRYISLSHEYILIYFKNVFSLGSEDKQWREDKQGLDEIYEKFEELKAQYQDDYESIENGLKAFYKSLPKGHPAKELDRYCKVDSRDIYYCDNLSWPNNNGGPKYEVLHPVTKKPVKVPSKGWRFTKQKMEDQISENRIHFGVDENIVPTFKGYLKERAKQVPYSVIWPDDSSRTPSDVVYKDGRAATKDLKDLFGSQIFNNPKDVNILERLVKLVATNKHDIVMDFFSGSASTAEAVMRANISDGMERQYIMVQLNEKIEVNENVSSNQRNDAACFLESLGLKPFITEIGKERIRLAAKRLGSELDEKSIIAGSVLSHHHSLEGKAVADEGDSIESKNKADATKSKTVASKDKTAASKIKTDAANSKVDASKSEANDAQSDNTVDTSSQHVELSLLAYEEAVNSLSYAAKRSQNTEIYECFESLENLEQAQGAESFHDKDASSKVDSSIFGVQVFEEKRDGIKDDIYIVKSGQSSNDCLAYYVGAVPLYLSIDTMNFAWGGGKR